MNCRSGLESLASARILSTRRKVSWRRHRMLCLSLFESTARLKTMIRAACRSRVQFPLMAISVQSSMGQALSTRSKWKKVPPCFRYSVNSIQIGRWSSSIPPICAIHRAFRILPRTTGHCVKSITTAHVSFHRWHGMAAEVPSPASPDLSAYTALRDSPLADAIKSFMISHANLPRRSRLWTFGAEEIADSDGWIPSTGTQGVIGHGIFTLRTNSDGYGALESPDDLSFHLADYRAIIVKARDSRVLQSIRVESQKKMGNGCRYLQ